MKHEHAVILAIDDEEEIRYSLSELFATQGWKTVGAEDMLGGLRLFNECRPDIVLIDYHMPDINGIKGVQMLRALNADVPIIVFTIDESQEVADEFLAAGASDFAVKPIKAPDLLSRIRLHLRMLEQRTQEVVPPQTTQQSSFISKGIVRMTLELIEDYFENNDDFLTADAIAQGTGLAYQTVYRYLDYMVKENQVEVRRSYGKIGRPRQTYRLIRRNSRKS
ncbi:MAG: response regulator [Lachnospiraceae bacterium]|nr:response regulator [Lachnospiraceae bacterium]